MRRLFLPTLARFGRDQHGSMVIETALVAPILTVLALGGFEASRIVARQTEIQSAVAEAASIVRATPPETPEERTTIRNIVATSLNLTNSQDVTVTEVYRCGTSENYQSNNTGCGSDTLSTYIRVNISTSYSPKWTEYGIGEDIDYNVERTVLVG